jgi:hypothetical protein
MLHDIDETRPTQEKKKKRKFPLDHPTYLKASASRVALLLLGTIDRSLSTGTLAARRLALSAWHFLDIKRCAGDFRGEKAARLSR